VLVLPREDREEEGGNCRFLRKKKLSFAIVLALRVADIASRLTKKEDSHSHDE